MAGSQFGINKAALMHKHPPTITSEAIIEHIVGHIRADDGETPLPHPAVPTTHRPRNRPRNQTSNRWPCFLVCSATYVMLC